jgi:Trypsin-co-occurring domain 1
MPLSIARAALRPLASNYGAGSFAVWGGNVATSADVRIETVELDSAGSRQISSRNRTTSRLQDRRSDIEAAVREACEIVQGSVAKVDTQHGWRVSSVEAKFGLIVAAEAGVIVSRASAEASLEVTVTIEHD